MTPPATLTARMLPSQPKNGTVPSSARTPAGNRSQNVRRPNPVSRATSASSQAKR